MLTNVLRTVRRETYTTILDLIGLALIVTAAAIRFGEAAALVTAGLAVLAVSWSLSRPTK